MGAHPLEPHCLPDALSARVPNVHGRGIAPLLAQGNVRAVGGVVHAHNQLVDAVLAKLQRVRDVYVELVIPALNMAVFVSLLEWLLCPSVGIDRAP